MIIEKQYTAFPTRKRRSEHLKINTYLISLRHFAIKKTTTYSKERQNFFVGERHEKKYKCTFALVQTENRKSGCGLIQQASCFPSQFLLFYSLVQAS